VTSNLDFKVTELPSTYRVQCAQITRDLTAIAKFLVKYSVEGVISRRIISQRQLRRAELMTREDATASDTADVKLTNDSP